MEDGSPLCCLIFSAVFIIITGMMYGFYTALQNLNELTLEKMAQDNKEKADKLAKISGKPSAYIDLEMIITVIFMNLAAGIWIYPVLRYNLYMFFTNEPLELLPQNLLTKILAGAVVIILYMAAMIVLGVVVPRYYAACRPEKWACRLLNAVSFISMLLTPFVFIIKFLSKAVMLLTGLDPNKEYDNVTEEEIVSMVNEGHEQGVFEADEAEMINNIIEFGDKKADDIMTRRKSIVGLDSQQTLSETINFILKESYSRFPVYEGDIDNIIGILHLKDALRYSKDKENHNKRLTDVEGLLREPVFIPETRTLNTLFKNMQSQKIHMVIVIDEYGQTAGLIAMEDILEEIVGNILDEYDEEDVMILEQDDGSFIMNGMADLEDVKDTLKIDLDDEEYDTLNGFLISLLNRIPEEGENLSVDYGGYRFEGADVKKNIIQLVKVTKLEVSEEGENPEDNKTEE